MEAVKRKLNSAELKEKVLTCFEKGGDLLYLNKDILLFFNTRMKANVSMVHLGKALRSLGFERKIVKVEGRTVRCYNLKAKQW